MAVDDMGRLGELIQIVDDGHRGDGEFARHLTQVRAVDHRTMPAPQEAMKNAMALAMPGMTPAQRAKMQAELAAMPSAAQTKAEMAQLTEALQAAVRTGSPEEATFAKQQLQELRRPSSGSGLPDGLLPRLRERWTRVADTCAAQR